MGWGVEGEGGVQFQLRFLARNSTDFEKALEAQAQSTAELRRVGNEIQNGDKRALWGAGRQILSPQSVSKQRVFVLHG